MSKFNYKGQQVLFFLFGFRKDTFLFKKILFTYLRESEIANTGLGGEGEKKKQTPH